MQKGFSVSTPRAGSDRIQKSAKSLLSSLELISISQTSTQKYGSGHFYPFSSNLCPIVGCLRNYSDQSEDVLRILKFFLLISKEFNIFF